MKVAIVGAGIGGLCLAQGLRRRGIDVRIYERDAALDSRGQGYRLHLDAGPALHACLPPDLYELCVATCGRPSTRMTVIRGNLRVLKSFELGAPADPTDPDTLNTSVNRHTLREILAARLDDALEFGRACTGFEQEPDSVRLTFADGSSERADLLVAADGVNSPIRRHYLPHAEVLDTGTVCLYGRTPLTERTRSLIPDYLWHGFTAVAGPRVGMAAGVLEFREPPEHAAARIAPDVKLSAVPGYLMWALTARARRFAGPLDGANQSTDPVALHAVAVDTIRRWHRDLRGLVEAASVEETTLTRIRTAVPIGAWPASRVTLLGDAIHAMSPSRGSGANTALRDAALLTQEIDAAARGRKPLIQAVEDYERAMVDYGFAAVRAASKSSALDRLASRLGA
jgi:2-polyprenyl-6-methoxyphenol hydroxylase-like FAD-dependent oxidoreductase